MLLLFKYIDIIFNKEVKQTAIDFISSCFNMTIII